jgi:hypothetical protein
MVATARSIIRVLPARARFREPAPRFFVTLGSASHHPPWIHAERPIKP